MTRFGLGIATSSTFARRRRSYGVVEKMKSTRIPDAAWWTGSTAWPPMSMKGMRNSPSPRLSSASSREKSGGGGGGGGEPIDCARDAAE